MMLSKSVLVAAVFLASSVHCLPQNTEYAPNIKCTQAAYRPGENASVPKVVINLDLPPEERWKPVVELKRNEIIQLRTALVDLLGGFMNGAILKLIDKLGPSLHSTLPSPYKEEMQALSNLTGMNLGEVVLYNVFYEFFTVCTSIVAQAKNGDILHARNLDFGLFLGWNTTTHSWSMTEILRKNVIQIEWQKGGKTLYHSVNFAGYIGVITGVKPGKLSLTMDERFNINGGFIGLFQWIVLRQRDLEWVGFLGRDIFESDTDFEQAKAKLVDSKLIAPVYFILGGAKPGEGAIITKDRNKKSADVLSMAANGKKYANWYVLETNYDHWKEVPAFDDRRTSGNACMLRMGQENVSFAGIYNVLSTQPNLNKLTAYTALMNVNTGEVETYLQRCLGNCSPW